MTRPGLIVCVAMLSGVAGGAFWFGQPRPATALGAPAGEAAANNTAQELARLEAQMAMMMADYHATNLWFAGRNSNWPLADYYWEKVQEHITLSAELAGGLKGELEQMIKAMEESPQMQVAAAIRKEDARAFNTAYEGLLAGCYDCHKAAGRPYLRPRMPARPSRSIINVDPNAAWPK